MADKKIVIAIPLSGKEITLTIYAENEGDTLVDAADAIENGEARYQLMEGCYYEYRISDGYILKNDEVVSRSKVNKSAGRFSPNIYVGTLQIVVIEEASGVECATVRLEVQSVKTNYREDYRLMLEEITEQCTDLLMQHTSPVSQNFETDFETNSKTSYQRFAFIKSIIDSEEFNDSVHKIISAPVTRWRTQEEVKDVRNVRRFSNSIMRQMAGPGNRTSLPERHPLYKNIHTIPTKITVANKSDTVDTPENRFVKHALICFQNFCSGIGQKLPAGIRLKNESAILSTKIEQYLNHSFFKDISDPVMLPLNSPVLQRKEGYREVLRAWLMFDLAAKLAWSGGEDVYSGNKRDVATLYEYWLFFKLLGVIKDVFKIDSVGIEKLMETTADGTGLKLKQGRYLALHGIYVSEIRKLQVEFAYNRTFTGRSEYPAGGSWTRNLRPDYTLTIWPYGIEQEQAEKEELIVHIHFDAKYKIEKLQLFNADESAFEEEKKEENKGNYKRIDLLKMHTYRDAIRRTAGAYILYPGSKSENIVGFHELLPGLGAFAIRPSKYDTGTDELKKFLQHVLAHFMNRASNREKMSLKTYETYNDNKKSELNEALPEPYGVNRAMIPDETFVLIAYYRKENLNWIIKSGLYNARTDSRNGSLRLGPGETGARYLLLHTEKETKSAQLFKIMDRGPRVFSKQQLKKNGYPSEPSQDYYIVYKVKQAQESEFVDKIWDITKLPGYKPGSASALPFAVTMTELMKTLVK